MRAQLGACGFTFASQESLEFTALEYVKGHADGVLIGAPSLPGVHLALPAIWECKCIYSKGWRALAKDGLAATYPKYATQVALYQYYLDKRNPALFTAVNADSAEALHLLVAFDRTRTERAIARPRSSPRPSRGGCSSAPTMIRLTFAACLSVATTIAAGSYRDCAGENL